MALVLKSQPSANPKAIDYLKKCSDWSLKKILEINECESLVPFNLWFKNKYYEISDNYENFQHIRLRFFYNNLLTPLQTNSADHAYIETLRSILPDMTLYQPFYPETFYEMWELQMSNKEITDHKFLVVAKELAFGSMEALMLFCEKYQHTYQQNIYDMILAEKPTINDANDMNDVDELTFQLPEYNYLGQAYSLSILQKKESFVIYDVIAIDCLSLKENIVSYKFEREDLAATLFYVEQVLDYLRDNGKLILHVDYTCSVSWSVLFDILNDYFKEITIKKPSSTNPLNTRIYVEAIGFNLSKFKLRPAIYFALIENYYLLDLYKNFSLEYINKDNKFWTKFLTTTKVLIESIQTSDTKKFCDENDLVTISHIESQHKHMPQGNTMVQYKLTTDSNKLTLTTSSADKLFAHPDYKKLISKRGQLNACKRTMDTKPSTIFVGDCAPSKTFLTTWDQLSTQIQMPYYTLKKILRNNFNAEYPTNAWTKMYEMLCFYEKLIPKNKIRSFHLCEAPGAFILATNHFAETRGYEFDWRAQTLRPNNTNDALHDGFGLIASYPDRWLFGEDDSGDITKSSVIKSYAQNPKLQNLDFMTADAGLICSPQELNEQETKLCKINLGQVTCILACLKPGKSAIFKTFLPLSEPLNLSLMYVLVHHFKEVYLTKPATSNACNSEVYVVLNGFMGIEQILLDALYELLDLDEITAKTLFCAKMKTNFYKSYLDVMTKLIDRQINAIHESYYYYYNMKNFHSLNTEQHIKDTIHSWLEQNPVAPLAKESKLLDQRKTKF
jgi:23S rRNA U2552 (ribose-2'-O)-methylase RlmE/FtsJ